VFDKERIHFVMALYSIVSACAPPCVGSNIYLQCVGAEKGSGS